MNNGWRPKWVRNNYFTTQHERTQLAHNGIYMGAYANRGGASPQPLGLSNTVPVNRFVRPPSAPFNPKLAGGAPPNYPPPPSRYPTPYAGKRQELLGFRDEWISNRHRTWGKDAPMVDIDFLVVEYESCRVRALVEYKCAIRDNGLPTPAPDFTRANYKTLINMADSLCVPMFAVYYDRARVTFRAYPANSWARRLTATPQTYSELEWVSRIYALTGRTVPDAIQATLSHTK
ncbi:MAG TPA: hypothetical protein PLZ51_08020 [Aggregatilineales bacterium]|nr:hypothetical protein [Aggregatilineales bacterium]